MPVRGGGPCIDQASVLGIRADIGTWDDKLLLIPSASNGHVFSQHRRRGSADFTSVFVPGLRRGVDYTL